MRAHWSYNVCHAKLECRVERLTQHENQGSIRTTVVQLHCGMILTWQKAVQMLKSGSVITMQLLVN